MDSSAADLPPSTSQGSEASLTPGQGTPLGTNDDTEESATAQRSELDRYTLVTSRKCPKQSESPPKAPQATRSLLKLTYEPGPRDRAVGVIKGVGDDVDDALLKAGLTSEIAVVHARRLGKFQVVRILFNGPKMPKYVLL
ncbi:hypothetical protein HPB47_011533 [Ixodes persulcatus]|uniref:Uncharacterized protein n=1 Tax=Ixodes persulcatus TaxID=34615 RepID=A0AC60NW23_IXOPE|nr:hypothetical protein HPB47_011533 [Ixodes persulcatus]